MEGPNDVVRELGDRFFEISIDMLCVAGFDGYFQWVNPAWEKTLGFTLEELRSRRSIEFVHPEDRERTIAQNREVRAGGQARDFENRYLCKDGTYRWLHWNAAPDFEHQVIYSAARDITAMKGVTAEREALVEELRTALAEIRTLRAILPVCSYCERVRDTDGSWSTIQAYISRHTSSRFSHGVCPDCLESEVEPMLKEIERK